MCIRDSHRGTERQRSHEVGGADEHLQSPGRGDPDGGAYQQLTLNLFLSEAEPVSYTHLQRVPVGSLPPKEKR